MRMLGFILLGYFVRVFGQNVDVSTLSELPLEKLLQVQKTFLVDENLLNGKVEIVDNATVGGDRPEALALQVKRKPHERGGYHHVYTYEDDKKEDHKDIQSIFQISVTTLAFLAFGGYLLCLLCQAISSKNDMSMTDTNTQIVQALIKQGQLIRRGTRRPNTRKRKRRPANNISYRKKKLKPFQYSRLKRENPNPDPDPSIITEKMYWALIRLSEGYSSYHTIDYRRYNHTHN